MDKGAQWLSGRVLDTRRRGRWFEPHRHHCVVSLSKNINPSLVLVQPRKTCPLITERLLMGRKESNQIKSKSRCGYITWVMLWLSIFYTMEFRKMTILWSFSYNSFLNWKITQFTYNGVHSFYNRIHFSGGSSGVLGFARIPLPATVLKYSMKMK